MAVPPIAIGSLACVAINVCAFLEAPGSTYHSADGSRGLYVLAQVPGTESSPQYEWLGPNPVQASTIFACTSVTSSGASCLIGAAADTGVIQSTIHTSWQFNQARGTWSPLISNGEKVSMQWAAAIDPAMTPSVSSISCGTATTCMTVSANQSPGLASIVATNDGGRTWIPVTEPSGGLYPLVGVACANQHECIGKDDLGNLYFTSTLGASWSVALTNSTGIATFYCESSSNWCVLTTNAGGAMTSSDAGKTWVTAMASGLPSPTQLACLNDSDCMAITSSGVETTKNEGVSWTLASPSILQSVSCTSLTFCIGTEIIVDAGGTLTNQYEVVASSDFGTSWSVVQSSSVIEYLNTGCLSSTDCTILGLPVGMPTVEEHLYVTSDGGVTLVDNPLPTQEYIADITCVVGSACFAAGSVMEHFGSEERSGLLLSTNGVSSPTFAPPALTALGSAGGTDGSQPCVACELKAMGLGAQGFNGDPVNNADGDFSESIPVVSIPGKGPNLSLTLTYDAQSAQHAVSAGSTSGGPFGWGWAANDTMSVTPPAIPPTQPGTGDVTLVEQGGARYDYVPVGSSPGPAGSTCVSSSGTQCYLPSQADVTATLSYSTGWGGVYLYSRGGGLATYLFNTAGQLVAILDRNGYAETFSYNVTTGSACTGTGVSCEVITDASGRTLDLVSTNGQVTEVVGPGGRSWHLAYDSAGNLLSITDPRGEVTSSAYDGTSVNPTMVHDLTTLTKPNGQAGGSHAGSALHIAYEESSSSTTAPLGWVISQTDPAGLTTTWSYAGSTMGSGGATTITGPTGNQIEELYEGGVLTERVVGPNTPTPEVTTFDRNNLDMVTTVIAPDGSETHATYDANGNMLTSTNALGYTTTNTYNAFNELLTSTPPSGSPTAETVNTYDANGNLLTTSQVSVTNSSAPPLVTSYGYSTQNPGLPSSVTDPDNHTTTLTYDSYGDVASVVNALGATTSYATNVVGQRYCTVSPVEVAKGVACPAFGAAYVPGTQYVLYDPSDMVPVGAYDADGHETTFITDGDGNLTATTDGSGNVTATSYDADDRVSSVTGGSGSSVASTTTYAYDIPIAQCPTQVAGATSCATETQGAGSANAMTANYVDALGNVIATVLPSGAQTTATYNVVNEPVTVTDGSGTVTLGYYPTGWLESRTYSSPAAGYSASSNANYSYTPDGLQDGMTDGTGRTATFFDPYGRVWGTIDGANNVVTYGYDNAGNLTCLAYPMGGTAQFCSNAGTTTGTGVVTYGYDAANEMTSMKDWLGNTTTFGYDQDGNLTTST